MTDTHEEVDADARRWSSTVGLGYRPGIDGLRALAVAGVVAFHLWPRAVPGGFLGVSLFFTLSGFLITGLLLDERARTGTVSVARFLGRRFRRLAPLSLVVIGVVAAWALVSAQPRSAGGEILASLFYVNNWWAILRGGGYGQLFTDPSPLEHFWSLAIEEQFYLVFPWLALLCLRRSRTTLTVAVGVLLGVSVLTSVLGVWGTETTYLSTVTRAAEILAGSVLALCWRPGPVGSGSDRGPRPLLVRWAGPAAVAVFVAACFVVDLDDRFVYRGLLPLLAVAWCAAVAWSATGGPHDVMRSAALVWIGRRSYAIYLIHWPVIVWWRAPALAQLALTLVLAAAAHALVEEPVRTRRVLAAARPAAFAGIGVMAVLAVAGAVVALRPVPTVERIATGVEEVPASTATTTTTTTAPTAEPTAEPAVTTTTMAPRDPVVWWVGDSQADALLDYLTGRRDPEADPDAPRDTTPTATRVDFLGRQRVVVDLAVPGCDGAFGITGFPPSPSDPGRTTCTDWRARWRAALDAYGPPDVVVWMQGAVTFTQPWVFEDGSRRYPDDAEWQRRWREDVRARLDWIDTELPPDAEVLWTEPVTPVRSRLAALVAPSDAEWARTLVGAETVRAVQRELAAGRARVVLAAPGAGPEAGGAGVSLADGTYDGIHWNRRAAATTVLPWLFGRVDGLTGSAP